MYTSHLSIKILLLLRTTLINIHYVYSFLYILIVFFHVCKRAAERFGCIFVSLYSNCVEHFSTLSYFMYTNLR